MIGNASNMRFGTMIYIRARNNCMFAWDISGPVTLFLVFLSSHVFVTIMCCTLNFKVGCGEEFNLIRNIKLVMVRVFQLRFLLTWFRPLQISDWRSYFLTKFQFLLWLVLSKWSAVYVDGPTRYVRKLLGDKGVIFLFLLKHLSIHLITMKLACTYTSSFNPKPLLYWLNGNQIQQKI